MRLFCTVLSLLIAPIVFCHEFNIEEVNVFGRKTNLIGAANSASEGKVSQEELALRPLLRVGKILEAIPGMVATQHSGSGKANQYFLRGFNLDHGTDFATSVDNMPVNLRTHGHGQGYSDLNFIIPELVNEISYKKGSYYADVGDFSGTGSAEIYSANELPDNVLSLALGEHEYARFLTYGQLESHASKTIYGVSAQTYAGPWDDIDEDIAKTNLWLKHQWLSESNHLFNMTFMAYNNEWNSADQIPHRAVEQGYITEYGSIDDTVGGDSGRYSLSGRWQYKLADNKKIDATVYAIDYDLNLWSNFSYFTQPEGDQFKQKDNRKIYGWDVRYGVASEINNLSMTNIVGSQFRYDDIDEVGLFNSVEREVTGVYRSDAVEQYSTSLFWENTMLWTSQLRSTLGMRYDYFHFDVTPLAARVPSTTEVNGGTADDDIVTSSLSLIYTFNPVFEGYASLGEGFHSNDARGTTIEQDPNTGDPIEAADPLVKTRGYELGLRMFTSDKINASLAFWHLDIDSELLFIGDEGTTEDTGVGSQREGVELTTYYYLNDQWTFDIEFAHTNARFEKPVDGDDVIPGALENVVSAGVNVQWKDELFTHLRLRYFDEYPLDGGEVAQDSTLVNLRLGYALNDVLTLTVDALNLFDSNDRDIEYFYESQLLWESAPVADHHHHVFEPRSFRVYLKYRY